MVAFFLYGRKKAYLLFLRDKETIIVVYTI